MAPPLGAVERRGETGGRSLRPAATPVRVDSRFGSPNVTNEPRAFAIPSATGPFVYCTRVARAPARTWRSFGRGPDGHEAARPDRSRRRRTDTGRSAEPSDSRL